MLLEQILSALISFAAHFVRGFTGFGSSLLVITHKTADFINENREI